MKIAKFILLAGLLPYSPLLTQAQDTAYRLEPEVGEGQALKSARPGAAPVRTLLPVLVRQATPKMVPIPGGSFLMGSNDGDENEKPVRRVTLRPFKMGKYPITFAQYDAFAEATDRTKPNDEGWGRGNRPVINVSWRDATAFANWLSKATGQRFRLPSEAEWEYAARAGSTTKYSWGDDIGHNRANCNRCGSRWDDSKTAPVGSFTANDFGLYDMHGNVWEWTQDCWNGSYSSAPRDGSAWRLGNCSKRVLRGGAWFYSSWKMRSAYRYGFTAAYRFHATGFRLVQDL